MNERLNYSEIEIPAYLAERWQKKLDQVAEKTDMPLGFIMQLQAPYIKVVASHSLEETVFDVGDQLDLQGTFCEEVVQSKRYVLISDATKLDKWKENPQVKQGIVSYLGFPIRWPNGEIFGTICLNDLSARDDMDDYLDLVDEVREFIESELKLIFLEKIAASTLKDS